MATSTAGSGFGLGFATGWVAARTTGLAAGLGVLTATGALATGLGLGLGCTTAGLLLRSFRVAPSISSSGLLRPLSATSRCIGMP